MGLVSFWDSVSTIRIPIGAITAPYGSVDSVHLTPHKGIDLYCPINSPIYAPLEGIVSKVHDYGNTGLGKAVFVKLNDGRQYIMGHFNEIKVHVGDRVDKGDLLGLSGSTGHSTGGHLHFGALDKAGHFINPEALFESVSSNFTLWIHKAVVISSESGTAFIDEVQTVSFEESASLIFKLINIATHII